MEDELSRQTLDAFFHQLTNFGRSMIAQLPECKAKELFVVAAPATSTLLLTTQKSAPFALALLGCAASSDSSRSQCLHQTLFASRHSWPLGSSFLSRHHRRDTSTSHVRQSNWHSHCQRVDARKVSCVLLMASHPGEQLRFYLFLLSPRSSGRHGSSRA